jgi:tetratricopeptide (TPR) repeat protein
MDARGIRPAAGSLRARREGMMKRTGRLVAVASLAVLLFVVGGLGLLRRVQSEAPSGAQARVANSSLQEAPIIQSGTLSQLITGLQSRLRAEPDDWRALGELGSAYVQQARVTADPSYYPKAEAALQRSLALSVDANFDAMTGMAALAAARHDFAGALRWGERARAVNPYNANIHAVIGDAQIELGRYLEAFQTYQKAVDLKPNLSTYARASYAWELQGNVSNAIRAMNLARGAAGNVSDASWADNQLGDLYFNSGRLGRATAYYRRATQEDPSFVPPRAGLARVEAARGHLAAAIAGYRSVTARYPLPQYVIALDDLYTVTGQKAQAAEQSALVQVEERLFQANGVNVDLEIALFDADHRIDLSRGLAAAQAEWSRRHSVHVADALAWELYANGQPAVALTYADRALRLGYRNALFYFHRAMIERALGRMAAARRDLQQVRQINPYFSPLWSGVAARMLASTGAPP